MADQFRFRHGQKQLQKFAVASATVIEKGDLVYLNTSDDTVKSAASFTWDTNLATTQAGFAAVFVGVAEESSAAGDTASISVDTSPFSVYEFDAASATYVAGDSLGPDKASGDALLSRQLEAAVAASSVARVYEGTAGAATKVLVTFASAYGTASANTNAALG